jgi:hypothetical protein
MSKSKMGAALLSCTAAIAAILLAASPSTASTGSTPSSVTSISPSASPLDSNWGG